VATPLIEITNLSTVIPTEDGIVRAVNEVSFDVPRKRTIGVVGESGCGKSITGFSLLQLIPKPGYIEKGSVKYYREEGKEPLEIAKLDPQGQTIRSIRGNEIAMIFQEPMTALNPVYTVGEQIGEALRLHKKMEHEEAKEFAVEMLQRVGIPSPHQRVDEYPHQLSGGLRQRVCIAMALSCKPSLLIADEPSTALDVTVQAQVLDLMKSLQDEMGMAIMMITHDMGVIADISEQVVVMYSGYIVEGGDIDNVFYNPLHPYTRGLLASVPVMGRTEERLNPIPGTVPHPLNVPSGCPFRPRCKYRRESCKELPPLREVEPGHSVRCRLYEE
jgi:oligopeptide/dipeptide ABC transporter ATP-binding protein